MAVFETAADIMNDAALQLGLITTAISDPFGSEDQNIIQLRYLLESLGQDLIKEHDWAHLRRTESITTLALTPTYALPADFDRMVDGTAWNRTQDRMMVLASPQQWHQLQATGFSGLNTADVYRLLANKFELYNTTPTASETITYEYVSNYWADTDVTLPGTLAAATASTNYLLFDAELLKKGLKLAFQTAKGMDTTAAQAAYDRRLSSVGGADSPAHAIGLNGSGALRLISAANVPDTGFGS